MSPRVPAWVPTRTLAVVAAAATLVAVSCPYLPPDLQRSPVYAVEFFTKENGTVNTPVFHEVFGLAMGVPEPDERASRLRVAPGFELSVFAEDIPHPRMLRVTSRGDVLVSQPRKGRVLVVRADRDGDGATDGVSPILEGLDLPHGIELWREPGADPPREWLYVAEPHAISRARFDTETATLAGPLERVAALPETTHHNMRSIRFGPDGWLYFPIGSNCNKCEPTGPREQVILRMKPDGSAEEVVAWGIRNVIGFDWRPATGAMYVNDIGADYLGDDFPPEELNEIRLGSFYGFPYAHGDRIPDPDLYAGHEEEVLGSKAPVHTFGAHATPLGLIFLRDPSLPLAYRDAAIVALHGSWNRTRKSGHALVSLHWRPDGRIEEREFVSGFELDEDVVGRPVDVALGADGTVFVSDDYAGAIYQVHFRGDEPPVARGRALFEAHGCAGCHLLGQASAVAPDLASLPGLHARYTSEEIAELLGAPPAAMPRAPLDAADRDALAAFLLAWR